MIKRPIAGILCLYPAFIFAASMDMLSEEDYFSEQPIVLSASRLSQPANRAPAAVTIITREMIEASGFRHLVDVLRLVPGFVVGWSGGNMPAATYMGLSGAFPHWMQVMVDGRSAYNPAYGHITWRGIPLTLDDVDRIEVVRGPNAANDGLNSMLGTIHIFTRHASTTIGGMAETAGGDKNYREANFRYGAPAGTGNWRLGLLAREDERHGVSHDHATDLQISLRGDFQPTPQDNVMLQLGASRNFWQGTNVGMMFSDDQESHYLTGFANLQWKRNLSPGREWILQANHTFQQNQENLAVPPTTDPIDGNYRTAGSSIQFTYLDQSRQEWRTSLSGEYRLHQVKMPAMLGTDGYLEDHIFRLSGGTEWSVSSKWTLHAAAMLEQHSHTSNVNFSPRLALNWFPAPGHAFRLGASQAATALGLYANHLDTKFTINGVVVNQIFLTTRKVDPEKIKSIELAYLLGKPAWGLNFDTRVFYSRIYDGVDMVRVTVPNPYDPNDKAKTPVNRIEISQRGLEYQLTWKPSSRGWLTLSQSWVDTQSNDSSYPPSVPRHTLSLLAFYPMAGIDLSLGYYLTSNMLWKGSGPEDTPSQYDRVDLRFAKDWKTAHGKIRTSLVLQKLLGKERESFNLYAGQEFDRRAYFSLRYEF